VLVDREKARSMLAIVTSEMTLEMDKHNPLAILRDWLISLLKED